MTYDGLYFPRIDVKPPVGQKASPRGHAGTHSQASPRSADGRWEVPSDSSPPSLLESVTRDNELLAMQGAGDCCDPPETAEAIVSRGYWPPPLSDDRVLASFPEMYLGTPRRSDNLGPRPEPSPPEQAPPRM